MKLEAIILLKQVTQRQIVHNSIYMRYLKWSKITEIESRIVVSRGCGKGQDEEFLLND